MSVIFNYSMLCPATCRSPTLSVTEAVYTTALPSIVGFLFPENIRTVFCRYFTDHKIITIEPSVLNIPSCPTAYDHHFTISKFFCEILTAVSDIVHDFRKYFLFQFSFDVTFILFPAINLYSFVKNYKKIPGILRTFP